MNLKRMLKVKDVRLAFEYECACPVCGTIHRVRKNQFQYCKEIDLTGFVVFCKDCGCTFFLIKPGTSD